MRHAEPGLKQAKQPVALLAGPYGHPIHPALVTVPIGAWVAALVFDIGSRLVEQPGFLAQGARWLIVIGILGALASALAGFLDLFAIPAGTRAYRTGLLHMTLNLAVTGAYVGNFLLRDTAGTAGTGNAPVGWGPLVLSAVSLLVLGFSGYLGGKLAFRYGVRVAGEQTQAEGYRSETETSEPLSSKEMN